MTPNIPASDCDNAKANDAGNHSEAVEGRPRSPGAAVVDRTALLGRVGGDAALLAEIVDLFKDGRVEMSARVHAAIAARDAKEFVAAAHALKGAVGNLAGLAAFAVADQLHAMALCADLDRGAATACTLDRELERLQSALISFCEEYEP